MGPRPISFANRFAPKKSDGKGPSPLTIKGRRRRFAQIAAAAELLRNIPERGECLHAILTGRYQPADLLGHLLDLFGPAEMHAASLSISRENVTSFLQWIDDGKLKGLELLVSSFWVRHNRAVWERLHNELEARGKAFRVAHARNHCKVFLLSHQANGDQEGERFVMAGSANLRAGGAWEQVSLDREGDSSLYRFHRDWIVARVAESEDAEGRD